MKRTLATLAFLLLVSNFSAAQPGDQRFPVFVRSAGAAGGFTDPDKARTDSVRDLQNAFKNAKAVRLVETEDQALILIEVLGRETRREVNGFTFLTGDAQNKSVLMVRLNAAGFSTEFSADGGSSGMLTAYGRAAKKVAQQIEKWVLENRPKLAEAMHAADPAEASAAPPLALRAQVHVEGDAFVVTNGDDQPWHNVILEVNGAPTVPGYRATVKTIEAGQVFRIAATAFHQKEGLPLNMAEVRPLRVGILASIGGQPGVVTIELQ